MSNYEVGQILYLANEKSFKIIPVQVVEEVVRTTIEGKVKTYLIKFPDKNRTVVDIKDIKYKCFKTENDVESYLLENTKKAIKNLLTAANEIKREVYSTHSPHQESENFLQPNEKEDIISIDLGNGQKGKLKVEDLTKVKK